LALACVVTVGAMTAIASAGIGEAAINIEFRPGFQTVKVGEVVEIGVYLVGVPDAQLFSAAQIIFEWDNTALQLTGLTNAGAIPLLVSTFPANDPTGYNETVPPQDGDGTYLAFAQLGVQTPANPRGTLVTTFLFEAIGPGTISVVEPIEANGETKVFSGVTPNTIVTGTLMGAVVEVTSACSGVFADLNCDGVVDGADLGILLNAWGTDDPDADLNNDGIVDGADLGMLLNAWS